MSDRNDWKGWLRPIIERAIAAGLTEHQFIQTFLEPRREQVKAFYKEILREQKRNAA